MKTAYFGMDALADCLEVLLQGGHEVIKIFTTEGDAYDHTEKICAFAREHGIPLQQTCVTKQEIDALQQAGAELTVTAGYPWKIPVTDAFMQVNLHPAYLPEGRGPWPMPVAILRKPLIRMVFGEEVIEREETISIRKYGPIKMSIAILVVHTLFLVIYTAADGAGTRPFWFNAARVAASLVPGYVLSLIVSGVLLPDKRK